MVIFSAGIVFGLRHNSLAYGVTSILLGLSSLIASALVIDYIMDGGKHIKGVTIVTDKTDEILEVVLKDLEKGATVYLAEGAYTGKQKKVISTVVGNRQIYQIKKAVKEIDPKAFVIVEHVVQVYGEGFDPLETRK